MHCTMLLGAWRWHWLLILLLASSFLRATAQSAISRLPATIPLALKSPYFNSWLPIPSNATEVSDPGNVWPVMWQTHLTGWIGFIRVDGRTYQWLGIGGVQAATPLGAYVTPTQTIFRLRAGPVDFNVTYLSPVEPSDWARQSFPFSYVSIDVVSGDGENHAVQIYTDVNGEWISPSLSATTRSTTTRTEHVIFHSLQCVNTTTPMAEDNEIALDSTLILASPNTNTVTTQTGPSANVRAFFDQNGGLSNAEDGSERPISPMYPAISIAVDLGGVSDTSSPAQALFAVGVLRDPVVQYSREGSSEEARRPYFLTKWSTVEDALEAFLEDFPAALSRATELDARIMSEARSAGSEEYVDLVGLSLRQVVASFDITTSEDPDAKDVKAFLKDIGTSSRANPVDALYASTPALLYLNPSLVGILLDPLLEAQSLSSYPHPYAVPDLGAQYPIATRIESEEHRALGLDSSASMLIMTYLHAQKSGEGHLLKKYHGLLKQWADFLVEHAASPSEFVTSDGLTQANNANLALKGILGVHAMSLINQALEKEGQGSEDTAHYAETAERLYTEWKRSAFISGRVISSYGQPDSWSSACNLYLARLLGADFVEDQVSI
ncbi:glutaminase GtaA, variant 2 [Coprinopsis cinerea AmutBmut pab1-1]|nr:glutaminase GtaA, variant 2 [Coprinopsis cinerea AmutBmut pab1-1]